MLGLLKTTCTLLSLLASIRLGSENGSPTTRRRIVRWAVAVKAHNQFSNWT
ncbi:MAG: hypothetical protein WBQ68_18440 [Terriglobales bacterium]